MMIIKEVDLTGLSKILHCEFHLSIYETLTDFAPISSYIKILFGPYQQSIITEQKLVELRRELSSNISEQRRLVDYLYKQITGIINSKIESDPSDEFKNAATKINNIIGQVQGMTPVHA